MKKRIISLLMALLMVLGMFPSAAFAAEADLCDVCGEPGCETEHIWCDSCAVYDCGVDHSAPAEETDACAVCGSVNCETEHVYCAVCAEYDCGLDHEAGLCPVCKAAGCETEHVWCDSCGVYDCGTDHSVPAPTPAAPAVDCSGDIGMYARLNPYFAESFVEVFDGVQVYSLLYTDFASDLVLTVANWHYDAASGYLWYQVYTAAGTLPQGMADGWWIRQAEAADNAGEKTLILTSPLAYASEVEGEGAGDTAASGDISEAGDTASPDDGTGAETVVCPVCGSENCEAEHIQCAVCQEYDCGLSHVWCDNCQKYDCGVNHSVCSVCGAVGCTEHSPCGVCGEYACTAEHIRCAVCGSYDCTLSHVWCDICEGYDCGVDHSSDIAARYGAYVGKYARTVVYPDLTGISVCDGTSFGSSNTIPIYFSELEENSAFSIDSWYYDEDTTGVWFRVSFVSGGVTDSGAEFWPEECWILHDYLAADDKNPPALELVELSSCPVCGKLNCNVQHEPCGICGEVSCSGVHFFCEICESYTCTLQHLYCNICERYDCPIDHSHRSRLTKFARSADYTESSAPITSPDIIPPSGGYGDVVISHNGVACSAITLVQGTRDSLSAWGAYADYQWQIRYDEARDLWADIKGQTAQGIVLSPAMFLGAFPGGAYIRCRMGSGEAAVYSSPVAVSFAAPVVESFRGTVGEMLSTTDGTGDSDKQDVVVQYLYADDKIAAANRTYQLQVGQGLVDHHKIPVIPGYVASLDSSFGGYVELTDNVLYLNFPDGSITENPTIITVRYDVDFVDYTVIHYLQNVDNDNYSEDERETVSNVKKTGEIIDTAHRSYTGFYNLLYETPAAAADGSTVIEVYYDRNYYLMTFDMGEGGYGTEPIYARYGSPVKADDPSRPGYTFLGWSLDGSTVVELPSTMPAGNVQYTAVWEATDLAKVSIVFWGENADDENYSYVKTTVQYVKPGTTFTYTGAGMDSNLWTFVSSDTVTVEANGSTVVNVYFARVEKTLTFNFNFKYGFNSGYRKTEEITAKWGADISEEYKAIAAAAGTTFWTMDYYGNGPYTNYFGIMPEASATYYTRNASGNDGTMTYYGESLSGEYVQMFSVSGVGGYRVTVEDRYEFNGFTYHHGTEVGSSCNGAKFYYTRNSYKLDFNNGVDVTRSESVKYEAPLDGYANYVPEVPDIYEPGSVVFDGWYLNPECSEGAKYDLNGKIMPAENIILYAKWKLVEHKVNYFMTRDSLDRDEKIPAEMQRLVTEAGGAAQPGTDPYTEDFSEDIVQHGSKIPDLADPVALTGYENIHPRAGYDFVGWFYIKEDKETPFDPETMPVVRDLNLYGKWSANKLCQYNVYFALDENEDGAADVDADGNIIYVAAPLKGSGIAGHTYTFTAKGETELYDGYKSGYFPNVGSHSITIDINDDYGTGNNSFTFLYRSRDAVPYTVKYLEKGTNNVLYPEKIVDDNRKVIVTETFEPVIGYMPDAYQKTLVVSAEEGAVNEIIFWYTKDETHSVYVVNHYTEIVDSNNQHIGWSKYTSFQNTGDIGREYSADAISIDGFTLSVDYTDDYNVTKKENGATNTPLPTEVSALDDTTNTVKGTLGAEGMELNFYYVRSLYPYEFRFVLKDTETELIDPETGKAPYDTVVSYQAQVIWTDLDGDGINEEYRLFDPTENEKEIRIRTDGDPLAADAVVAAGSAKVNFATFEYIRCTGNITVTKAVSGTGASDSFIFHINSADNSVDMDVVINGSGSVTVYDLPTGSYTVTEDTDWSWRYTPTTAASQTVILSHDSTSAVVSFANSFSNDQWLDKEINCVNTFTGVSGNY